MRKYYHLYSYWIYLQQNEPAHLDWQLVDPDEVAQFRLEVL